MNDNSFWDIEALTKQDAEQVMEFAFQMQQTMMLYDAGIREVKTKLEILNEESRISGKNNPIDAIKSRIKTPKSILEKMNRYGFPISLQSMMNNLNDIGGIRIICPFLEDIYTVADMLMRQDDLTLIQQKDYIANPKPNGYRSLHMIVEVPIFLSSETKKVRVELQIRTMAMDFWASLEHQLRYKSKSNIPSHIVDDLKECADIISATDQKMQRISHELQEIEE